jgi:hypothetical protein
MSGLAVSEADEDFEQPSDDFPSNPDDYYDPDDLANPIDAVQGIVKVTSFILLDFIERNRN